MKKIIAVISVLSSLLLAFSCQKGDGDKEYGNTLIYMPQAMTSGGMDNVYDVPGTSGEVNRNFVVTDESVNVILGVLRSGKQKGEAFSVDVIIDEAMTQKRASELGATAMPQPFYSLPEKVSVADGANGATFYLSLSKEELPAYAGKKLVLVVSVAAPTKYELSDKGTSTCVVVDVDAVAATL